ncbi:hypothetical protein [Pseudoalteromonas rubra]|uniref:hypothetical protein n=1 Tax=Pseudoalteromonas rubra TaxID=43658 RepID=UPI000F78D262|nr:hypothetical protein [Pseudoalteromonas rubra]
MEYFLTFLACLGFFVIQTLINNFLAKGYLGEKGKLLALAEEHKSAIERLEESTHVVESIKDDLSKRTWANQQLWLAKKESLDDVWKTLRSLRELIFEQHKYYDLYYDAYFNHGGFSGIDDNIYPPNMVDEYYEMVEREVDHQKREFKKTYDGQAFESKQGKLREHCKAHIKQAIDDIDYNSIYLSSDYSELLNFLKSASEQLSKDYSFTHEISEEECMNANEWYEHVVHEHQLLLSNLEIEMDKFKSLVSNELHFGHNDV